MESQRFEMKLKGDILHRVDSWRSKRRDIPSRAEAIRRLVDRGLSLEEQETIQLSSGEKIILALLINLCKQGNNSNDAELIEEAITEGHYWALREKFPGLYNVSPDEDRDVNEVKDILTMWDQIEWGFSKLAQNDKDNVLVEINRRPDEVQFLGFDGNSEYNHLNIANFLINRLRRFELFSGRNLNSHLPMIKEYRNMLSVYRRIPRHHVGESLTATEIIKLLNAERP